MPSRYLRGEIITSRWNRCSWMGQSFYIRLLGLVCDYGRCEADPTILCAQAFPTYPHFRTVTVSRLLNELAANELILLYSVDGKPYLQILRWRERVRQRTSRFPGPPTDKFDANPGLRVTPPLKVAHEGAPEADKQRVSQQPLLTTARQYAGNCPPPTPLALQPIYKDKNSSEGDQWSNSAEPPPHQKFGSKRLHGIPGSVEEVIAYGQSINPRIPEAQCCAFWAHYEGQARTNESGEIFWVTSGDAVVTNWKVKLPQFQTLYESNRTPDKRGAAQRPDRNAGTCNEGNHTKYGNLGRVAGAGNIQ